MKLSGNGWNYAQLAGLAKDFGGPEKLLETAEKVGFKRGIAAAIGYLVIAGITTAATYYGPKVFERLLTKENITDPNDEEVVNVKNEPDIIVQPLNIEELTKR